MIKYSESVLSALKENKPIVALESTIITHGLPHPTNLEMAVKIEDIIRKEGATPATIAIIDGIIHVGLTNEELIKLSESDALKASRADISYLVANKKTASTTVAATMLICKLVGIKVFVTGGIGGVHDDFQNMLDVSADLEELSKTDICVVCAGPKAILDIPKTMEYLETKGVPVVGYQTKELPAFYSRESGIKLNISLDTPKEIARLIKTQEKLSIESGVLVVNPIPVEAEIKKEVMDKYIATALKLAKENNIKGKKVTPFLLETLKDLTKGASLEANLALIYNNAVVGANISKELAKKGNKDE